MKVEKESEKDEESGEKVEERSNLCKKWMNLALQAKKGAQLLAKSFPT